MDPKAIMFPMCAQVLLTMVVWICLAAGRLTTLKRAKINPQELASDPKFQAVYKDLADLSDNFENLFEVPVLFYVAVLLLVVTGKVDHLYVNCAWIYVGSRVLHSLIHCTSNRIVHRFAAHFMGTLVLWAMWIRILLQLLGR